MPLDPGSPAGVEINIRRVGLPPGAFTADALDGRAVPPREWGVPGMVPAGQVTLLSGDGGVGKSTLALQLCCATALNCDWIGQTPRGGRALYLSAEDGTDEVHRRVDALSIFYGRPPSHMAGLLIWPLADQDDAAFVIADGPDSVKATPRWDEFAAAVRAWKPVLIVIDSLADVFAANEISRGQTRRFVSILRALAIETGAAIVVLSHPSLTGISTGTGLSGSTAWNNSVRSRLYLTRPKIDADSNADPDLRTLSLVKANYARSGSELKLRLQAGGFASDGNSGPGALDLAIQRDRVDDQFLSLLATYAAERRPVSDCGGRNYAPLKFSQDPRAGGTSRAAFQAAMNRLLAEGRIAISVVGPASRQHRELVAKVSPA